MKRPSGFTLVELMVVCTIVAILLAIGVPNYKYVTASNRVSSEVNGLLGDLQFARAEAIKQGVTVSVCAAASNTACATSGTNWATGWLVFTDSPVLGTVDNSDQVLRVQAALSGTDTFTADHSVVFVSFNRDGFISNTPNGVTFKVQTSPVNAQFKRCLSTSIVGAMAVQHDTQTTMEGAAC